MLTATYFRKKCVAMEIMNLTHTSAAVFAGRVHEVGVCPELTQAESSL